MEKTKLKAFDKNVRSSNPTVAPLAFVSGLGSRGHASAGILIITISIHPSPPLPVPGPVHDLKLYHSKYSTAIACQCLLTGNACVFTIVHAHFRIR